MCAAEFRLKLNGLRRKNKNNWYFIHGEQVDGKRVDVKGYNTWLQIFRVDGIDYSNPIDQSVAEFNAHLLRVLP